MEENTGTFSIKYWAEDDQPREKLMLKGKSVLSDAELIAILIGSGSRNESAVELSKRILASVDNNLNALGKQSLQQLMSFKGIGEAKEITIAAAMELGRRLGFSLGLEELGSLGMNFAIAYGRDGTWVIGVGISVGLGASATGVDFNINWGETVIKD